MYPSFQRAGITQICFVKDGGFRVESGLLGGFGNQLVLYGMRSMLWSRLSAMDVYTEKLSFQSGISDDQFELRIRNVCRDFVFS